jgi:hypothetical protein
MNFADQYLQTSGVNNLDFQAELKHSATIRVSVLDIGAELFIQNGSNYVNLLFMDADGVLIFVDGNKNDPVREVHAWLELLARQTTVNLNKYIVIHKADTFNTYSIGKLARLDDFVKHAGIEGWAMTVGHQDLGDMVLSRGSAAYQKAPADVLRELVLGILLKRQSNFCKLLPVPFRIEFVKWATYDFEDLDRFVASLSM